MQFKLKQSKDTVSSCLTILQRRRKRGGGRRRTPSPGQEMKLGALPPPMQLNTYDSQYVV